MSVDEYICEGGIAVKKEVLCPNQDCLDGACQTGTTTVWQECILLGFERGGCSTASSDVPVGCERRSELDTLCGDLYPLNTAFCCN